VKSTRRVLFIAGAGRSGTSTLAGLVSRLGLHVPQPEVAADESNPKGFGEPQWVVDFHNQLLDEVMVQVSDSRPDAWDLTGERGADDGVLDQAAAWLDPHFAEADELVIKDPRLSWFLPLWRKAAVRSEAAPVFATMLRPPAEVVGSKQKYYANRLGSAHLTASWLNMLLHTELETRDAPRAFVRYADLLGDYRSVISGVGSGLELSAVTGASDSDWARLEGFIDPSLRRVELDWADLALPPRLEELTRATWDALNAMVESDTPELRATLDHARSAYSELYAESEAISKSSVVAAEVVLRKAHRIALASVMEGADAPVGRPSVADRIPHSWRARVPAPVRRGLRRVLRHR